MIPARLVRTVPEVTTDEQEHLWELACSWHPEWEHVTLRDPLPISDFPYTNATWPLCESGAQKADLIRIEDLYLRGGVYIDSDVEVYRPFTPLLGAHGFAAWEDKYHIPNAVMGFSQFSSVAMRVLMKMIQLIPCDTWSSGVGVTTEVFKRHSDVMLLLPPGSFYPYHYSVKDRMRWGTKQKEYQQALNPWAFCCHHWAHSWK
jgi:Glycosyltransferase sugar-binding region containing DXD motif